MDDYQKIDVYLKIIICIGLMIIIYFLYDINQTLKPISEVFTTMDNALDIFKSWI